MEVFVGVLILFQCIAGTKGSKADTKAVRLSGMIMCERLCQQTVGCFGFGFSSRYLSCHIPPGQKSEKKMDDTIRFYNLTKASDETEEACPLMSRRFYNKGKQELCRSSNLQPPRHVMKRLLIARSRPGKMKQLSFINNEVSTYLDTFQGVTAIAYVPVSQKLVYYFVDSMSLMMSSLNGSDETVIKEDCDYLIAVAEDRIFFIASPTDASPKLMHVSPDGRDLHTDKNFKSRPQSMAVDLKRQLLYVEEMYVTYVYTYNGEKQSELEASNVYIEPYSDYLFLSDRGRSQYFRMSLQDTNNTKTVYASLDNKDGQICVHGTTLYILSPETCDIKVITNNQSSLIKVFEREKYMSCYCCLLP